MMFTLHVHNTHTHTHRVNVRTCIIDLRLPLQQAPTVIKKRPFCFISPLHHAYRLICIISSIWCRPRKRLPLWFPLLGILSHFVVSLSAAPHAGAPHRRRILNWNRSSASAESCKTIRALLPIVSTILSFDVDSLVPGGVNAEVHILQVKLIDTHATHTHSLILNRNQSTSQQQRRGINCFFITAEYSWGWCN